MDKAIEKLRDTGLELEDQVDMKDYLGINFQYTDDGKNHHVATTADRFDRSGFTSKEP